MNETKIEIQIEQKLKNEIEKALEELGMSVSEAFNLFARKVIAMGGIPFSMNLNETRYNKETEEAIEETRKIRNGEIKTKQYESFEEMLTEYKT